MDVIWRLVRLSIFTFKVLLALLLPLMRAYPDDAVAVTADS